MARRRRRHEDEMELNLIPMIDVMLILLIFFMVATTIKHGEKALPIELPKAEGAVEQRAADDLLVIGVDRAGNKYIGSERVTTDALHDAHPRRGAKERGAAGAHRRGPANSLRTGGRGSAALPVRAPAQRQPAYPGRGQTVNAPPEQSRPASPASRGRWYVLTAALGFGLWWLGSILLHALLLGAMYLAGPKSPVPADVAADDFHMTISPEHVASVVADIREQQKEEFTKKIEELASVKAQLDALGATKVEQYNALVHEEAKQAPQTIRQAAADVRASQESALRSQESAQAAIGKINEAQTHAAAARDDAGRATAQQELKTSAQAAQDTQAAASQAQKQASAAQAKLTQQINLFGDGMAAARQASEEATTAQAEAERQQDTAATTRLQWETGRRNIEPLATEAQHRHAATDAADQRVAGMEKRLAELQPPAASPATEPSPSSAAPPGDNNTAGTPTAPATPASTPAPAPTPSKQAKQEIDRLNKALVQSRDTQAKTAAREADAQQKLAAAQENAARQQQKLQAEEDQARQKQQAALEVQAKSEQTILAAAEKPGLVPASATALAAPPPTAPPDANLADLFHQAQQMETAVAESYKNVRAAELAAIREIPLSQAAALTEVAKPVRADIDTGLLTRDIRDVPGVRAQEKTLEAASEQMNSMVALAQRMRDLAQPAQTTVSVDSMKAASGHTEHMEHLAMEDEGTTAKDLTAAMQGIDGPGGGHGEASPFTPAALAAAARLAADPTDLNALLEYQLALAAQGAPGSGNGADGGDASGLTAGAGDGERTSDDPAHAGDVPGVPAIDPHHFKPIPGRTITTAMVAGPSDRQRE